jgi:hypothetical protein
MGEAFAAKEPAKKAHAAMFAWAFLMAGAN